MQHKRQYYSRAGVLLMAVIGVTIGIAVVLMFKDIPAPQQSIEKELDAKTFQAENK